jgi:hypothetical protein
VRYAPHPNVVARRLDDSVVLVHLETNRIFTLNLTGSRIWDLLTGAAGHRDVGELEAMLRAEYDVDDERLHDDVVSLVAQLAEERLLVPPEDESTGS